MLFPVDLTTTSAELLSSAANCFSEQIDPKNSVLVEYYGKVGAQRPLRRYEHVRDVMNSWGRGWPELVDHHTSSRMWQ